MGYVEDFSGSAAVTWSICEVSPLPLARVEYPDEVTGCQASPRHDSGLLHFGAAVCYPNRVTPVLGIAAAVFYYLASAGNGKSA